MRVPAGGLWRHPDFLKLWTAQTISKFGSGITGTALPLTALLALDAGPAQLGLLGAAGSAPVVLLGLFAGAWVDRMRRRPLMIAADLGRAALLALIPLAAVTGQLRMELLYVVAPLVGILTVLFDVAYQSFVPTLVRRERVVEANSRLATSDALAEVTTPGLAGLLVQLFSAPMAILLDAVSFVASALGIGLIRAAEPPPAPAGNSPDVLREVRDGLRLVVRQPLLRAIAGHIGTRTFFGNFIGVLYAIFLIDELGLSPVLLGLTIAVGGASNLVGTMLVEPVTRRFGVGPTMVGSMVVGLFGLPLLVLAGGPVPVAFAMLVLSQALDFTWPLHDVNALSLRQSIAPDHLLGRVNASMQVLEGSLGPAGAIAGGLLASTIGVRPTLWIAAAGIALSLLWLLFSPIPRLRALPAPAGDTDVAVPPAVVPAGG